MRRTKPSAKRKEDRQLGSFVLGDLGQRPGGFGGAHERRNGRVLDERDQGRAQGCDRPRNACGSSTSRSDWAKVSPDRAGRLGLARRNGVDSAAQGLTDEGGVIDGQHDDRPPVRVGGGLLEICRPSSRLSPSTLNTMSRVSGVLRMMLTYAVPKALSTATGEDA